MGINRRVREFYVEKMSQNITSTEKRKLKNAACICQDVLTIVWHVKIAVRSEFVFILQNHFK